jgi:hypothetical protein
MVIEKCNRFVSNPACENQVVSECLPVSAFGDVASQKLQVVTIGLNPALNEYYNYDGTVKEQSQRLAMTSDYGAARKDLSDADIKTPLSDVWVISRILTDGGIPILKN